MIEVTCRIDSFPLSEAFTILRGSRTKTDVVTVKVRPGGGDKRSIC
ncbi:hypothetical protein MnTg02_01940 [bacterium MnTg02]|nr:hypothetical protein MnTg02_01940 [bacterium MnTg02]